MIATHSMQNLVANFSGSVRREKVGGREFIVAPITLIVPGVLPGNRGALYYPDDEVRKSASYWDNVVLTDGHLPDGMNGKSLKTREQYGIGVVQNSRYENGKLRADGWFDVEKTRRLNIEIYQALIQRRRIEVSTGLSVDYEDQSGVFNGRSYSRIVRNYRPDHLAILLNARGACSLADGCGIHNEIPRPHQNCLCSSCLNQMSEFFQSELRAHEKKRVHIPAGGSLGLPEIDWGTLATGSPVIASTGGGLAHVEIDWGQQPKPTHAQQPSRSSYEDRDRPAGGSLGRSPTGFD